MKDKSGARKLINDLVTWWLEYMEFIREKGLEAEFQKWREAQE